MNKSHFAKKTTIHEKQLYGEIVQGPYIYFRSSPLCVFEIRHSYILRYAVFRRITTQVLVFPPGAKYSVTVTSPYAREGRVFFFGYLRRCAGSHFQQNKTALDLANNVEKNS